VSVPEPPYEAWAHDDYVHRSVMLPVGLAERLAAEAERRDISVSDLLVEYAEACLRAQDPDS
jgi:hypothetical protein